MIPGSKISSAHSDGEHFDLGKRSHARTPCPPDSSPYFSDPKQTRGVTSGHTQLGSTTISEIPISPQGTYHSGHKHDDKLLVTWQHINQRSFPGSCPHRHPQGGCLPQTLNASAMQISTACTKSEKQNAALYMGDAIPFCRPIPGQ